MIFNPVICALAGIVCTLLYWWLRRKQSYWINRHVLHDPSLLIFFRRTRHLAFSLQDIYERWKTSGASFVGMHMPFQPAVLLLDLDLIRRVFVADFESFPDRGFYHNIHDDPLSGNIVRLDGEPWRRLRTKLTPTFTSARMRYMFDAVADVGQRLAQVLAEQLEKSEGGESLLEIRDLCARFTTDVIGSVAFGIECNSLRDPETEFRRKGDKAFGCFRPVLESLAARYPRLFRRLHVKAFTQELIDFYTRIVRENIAHRERHQLRRRDFFQLLIDLRQSSSEEGGDCPLTLEEIIGQAFVFFIGGFETSSTTMTFCLYELSRSPEIQQKARADVMRSLEQHDNQLTYECLKDMKYLEQVFAETLRKYPVAPNLRRVTRKDYQVPETTHVIEKEVHVLIPVYAIHHDPRYYPNPSEFDPDRFSPEERGKRHPMTYLPFGAGPRVCIAERFGRMQTLMGLATLLRDFRFSPGSDSPEKPLEFDNHNLRIFSVKGGLHLRVAKI